MAERTFGWVQDPGSIKKLRTVVEVFDNNSLTHQNLKNNIIPKLILVKDGRKHFISELNKKKLNLTYKDLVGSAFIPRSSARCNGIIQAALKGQKRDFIADWPADNFLRWAQALGFIKWDSKTDSFCITSIGLLLSKSARNSDAEYKIYENAFLSYPPVSRIINLLCNAAENSESLTKFEIGEKLGFVGEEGFTSISQNLFVKEICSVPENEKAKIRSNWEGDSDKYARMICSWLTQFKYPWIKKTRKKVVVNFDEKNYSYEMQAYTITKKGYEIRKKILGKGKYKKVAKIVNFEMLSTKGQDRKYLRKRRANIIQLLSKKSYSLNELKKLLFDIGFDESIKTIKDDITGLINIGLTIDKSRNKYKLKDKIIGLNIPTFGLKETQKSDVLTLVEKCREEIAEALHKYLVLIPMSFEKKQSRLFEITTIEVLTEQCNFSGLHLGGTSKPDGLIYTNDYGVIIDTKSYESGFNIPVPERDKMKRYIEENQKRNPKHNKTKWWELFPKNINEFLFLFVSGRFGGSFKRQLTILSEQTNGTLGGALTSYALLRISNEFVRNKMNHNTFKSKISCLDEINFT